MTSSGRRCGFFDGCQQERLDDKQLWEIATVHLPQLHPVVAQMLTELDG
jgi:uncharacterized protein with HEPN domain